MLQIDYNYLNSIAPDDLRRDLPKRRDFLNLIISSVKKGYASFNTDYNEYKYLAQRSNQQKTMERILNTLVPVQNQIVILNGLWLEDTYVYILNEAFVQEEAYIFSDAEGTVETYLYSEQEYANDQVDFIVSVSSLDSEYEDLIRYYISLYLPLGKTYIIQYT